MCNCIEQVQKIFDKHFRDNVKSRGIEIHEVKEQVFETLPAVMFSGPLRWFFPYNVKYIAKKKDGTPEKRTSTFKTNLIASFCPICGKEYQK